MTDKGSLQDLASKATTTLEVSTASKATSTEFTTATGHPIDPKINKNIAFSGLLLAVGSWKGPFVSSVPGFN